MLFRTKAKPVTITNALQFTLTPMDFSDVYSCLEIEHGAFNYPWPQEEFEESIRDPGQRACVAKVDGEVVAYCVVEISATSHQIVNLAVHPKFRRRGIARRIVLHFRAFLGVKPFMSTFATVGERNLQAQLFFRSLGFLYTQTIKQYFNTPDDAYILQWRNGDRRQRLDAPSEGDYRGEALR